MYFKRLELSGFKSFADRTQVRLEPGITAVVGPNGCGKSNILDAMRWSLGEQSARELRGTHMLDVIFNGSENRQARGMAEVSITFDNSDSRLPVDFAEVQVTRRLYRSGESEYFINKTPCRLRDIHELFMDTGIGTSAYSLIGQGKIDLVLSSKPEDRRFLFEEAAGIIKYKARKKVAMRKMEVADQNLLRLSDVIAEVQRQMRSLKRQVNAAIRYREMKDQLRDLEVRSLWMKWSALSTRVAELRQLFATAQDTYEKAMTETTQFESRNEELAVNRMEVERRLAARREEVRDIDSEMEKVERQIALLRQQIDFLKEQQQQAILDQEEYSQRATEILEQIARTDQEAAALDAGLKQCAAQIEARQQEHDDAQRRVAEAEAGLESVRNRTVASMNDRAKAQAELESLDNRLQTDQMMLEGLYARRKTQDERNDDLDGQLNEARKDEDETLTALEGLADSRKAASDEHAAKSQQLREIHDERHR
ncbi:AAA family ATPase, partial [bacterium]|nr:AAA family ATPase [bacterium]